MTRNLKKEMNRCVSRLFEVMQAVHSTSAVPVARDLAAKLVIAAAYLGAIEHSINKTRELQERRNLIKEYDQTMQTLDRASAYLESHVDRQRDSRERTRGQSVI